MTSRFDLHTRVERCGEGSWSAELSDAWCVGPVSHGGYQIATMCRAALEELGSPDVVNLSCYFIAPAAPGPASLRVEVVKRGRSTSLAQVSLVQEGRERTRALVLAGELATFQGPELHLTGPPALPSPEDCPRLSPTLAPAPVLMNEVETRVDPATAGFLRPAGGERPELRAWMRCSDGRPTDLLALTCFADVLPPTTFNVLGLSPWVPTLELTIQLRRRPAPGWVRLQVVTRHISAGHFEEDGELWDEDDNLVAVSRQRAMLLTRSG